MQDVHSFPRRVEVWTPVIRAPCTREYGARPNHRLGWSPLISRASDRAGHEDIGGVDDGT